MKQGQVTSSSSLVDQRKDDSLETGELAIAFEGLYLEIFGEDAEKIRTALDAVGSIREHAQPGKHRGASQPGKSFAL